MPKPPANIVIGVDDRPPALQLLLLGMQYAFLLCVYLVIVVIVVHAAGASKEEARSLVSMAMLASAVGTVLQALHRGPVGSGYLAPPVFSAIYLGPSILAVKAGGLPGLACMTVCAGLTEIVIARYLHRLRIIMQPAITGLTICIIAMELGIVGLQHSLGIGKETAPHLATHVAVAGLTFAVAVAFTVWGRGVWRLVCSLLGMVAGVSAAFAFGLFDADGLAEIAAAPWLALPNPSYIGFEWDPGLLPAFIAAGVAAAIRTVGVVTTCQRANDASWNRPNFTNIRKGILADGIGCTIAGLVGAPGMNIGPSLVGVSIATGVTSRFVAYAAATVLVALAFMPKVADVFLQLPLAVAGALLVFTASIMLASGLQLMLARTLDIRFTFVIGLGILLPLTRLVSIQYFDALPGWLGIVTNSGLALGLTAGIGLLLLFRIASGRHQEILWKRSADALAELAVALKVNSKAWGLTKEVVERALVNTEKAIEALKEGQLMREPVAIGAAERDGSLEIELRYKGLPLYLPDLSAEVAETTEETPVLIGLQNVGLQVFVDRSMTITRGSETTLRLSFDM
ncbi:uracil-xanthine permease family protein [Acuticoccus kandeliae]|uniref:uracil-xanthine permease family protein n=1 Tax=Acuticoccus kandeliae TaxID=2073160 RepID=UPI000D3E58DE|nr:solute carrier family 23 protein [Acuticoccus kandeliae]